MAPAALANRSLCVYGLLIVFSTLYLTVLAARRLFFHSLSRFPGPRLASLTSLYKSYHEVFRGGKWLHHVDELHKLYGGVVRVGPNELHFNDPKVYGKIFSISAQFAKDPAFYACFGVDTSTFGLADPEHARLSREIMSIYFNRRAILQLEGIIQSKVDKLVGLVSSRQCPSDMFYAFRCATMDIIATHCFDSSSANFLDAPEFKAPLLSDIQTGVSLLWTVKSFPWILPIVSILPKRMGGQISRQLDAFIRVQEGIIQDIFNRFPSRDRMHLFHEGLSLIQAGSDPVATACLVGFFHILNDPSIHGRLREDLREAFPDLNATLSWSELERVPYLAAVIKESLRMSHGFVSALPRVVGPCGAQLAGYTVPPQTIVSMSAVSVHNNSTIFPEPHHFRPERWLESKDLGQYLVAFSRGPRMCLGINMAWAELYCFFGTMFRRLDMNLVDASGEDYVDMLDYFIPIHTGRHLHIQATLSTN
ncbi:benzoate 4-monooxygenase cytochrome P450 [Coprinellus micaceus]|uniref:Benzoate 4-monooxygenase cytochrome P450 n=1 Tax=Coprinellus micaceus TaxID=71717 RepID=A0A4Y7TMU5_COPMI|nr:benzoate 4-monooxygenase cytochrome P450 [Coprinellus micaceus]